MSSSSGGPPSAPLPLRESREWAAGAATSPEPLAIDAVRWVLRDGVRAGVVEEEAEVGGVGLRRRLVVKFLNAPRMLEEEARLLGVCGTLSDDGDMCLDVNRELDPDTVTAFAAGA